MARRFTAASSSPMVGVERFDRARHPEFARVLDRVNGVFAGEGTIAGWSRVDESCCAVVTNVSSRPIEAMVLRWSYEGTTHDKPSNLISDGFFNPPYKPILPVQERTLATPGHNLPEDLPEQFFLAGSLPRREMWAATHVHLDVDSVVLDDGSLTGDDKFGIVDYLRGQYSAAAELVKAVEEGLANGRSLEDVAAAFEDVRRDDLQWFRWGQRFALQVRRQPAFLEYLKRFRPLPANLGRRD
jgi:hypothetical protein